MNCKRCGAILVQGQTICSNCDEYNSLLQESVTSISSDNINFSSNENNFNQNEIYNHNNDTISSNYSEVEKENKKIPAWAIFVILAVVLLPIVVIGAVFLISVFTVSDTLSDTKDKSFANSYIAIERDVKSRIIMNDVVTCNSNCSTIYEYDEEDINLTVEDLGLFYKITYEANEDGKYSNVNLTQESCPSSGDSTCSGKRIVGRIYKN